MAKAFPFYVFVQVGDGQLQVGYSAKEVGGRWEAYFPGPGGKRIRKMTACEARGKQPGADFFAAVAALIRDAYRPVDAAPDLYTLTWEAAVARVVAAFPHSRDETVRGWKAAHKSLTATCPDCLFPGYISEDKVKRFCRAFLASPKATGGRRSPVTLSYYLRALSALSNRLVELDLLKANLWSG